MTQIFFSYRRIDSHHWQTKLYDHLHSHFGSQISKDIDNIPVGKSFSDILKDKILLCDVMLVIIGPDWLEAKNQNGQRRIDDEHDFIRTEIAIAFSLNKRVIPVLLDETNMPRTTDIPANLRELATKQPVHIREQSWGADINHLIETINEAFASGAPQLAKDRLKGVFISYSHKDEEWKDNLVTQLSVLELENLLHIWDDRKIQVGDNWNQKISNAMESASIAILLISADFLTSGFIRSEEVPKLLARQKQDGLRIVPLIVRPCAWKIVPWLAQIQVRPKDGRPLSAGTIYQIEQDLADLVTEIALFTS